MLNYMVHTWCKKLLTNYISAYKYYKTFLPIQKIKMAIKNTRWVLDASAWNPTEEQIIAASSYIQSEEKQRISKFVFLKDAKSSLIGRLMIRKYLSVSTDIPYQNIQVGRDENGKPYLVGASDIQIYFNVSHQGDFVVLAGNTTQNIGIDVMTIEPPVNKDIPDFFRLMKRQLSEQEWKKIHSYGSDLQKMACFYRIWCLKESYVKNIGVGITTSLEALSFSIKEELKVGEITTSTLLYENNVLKEDYVFEETLLNDLYTVAVAIQVSDAMKTEIIPFTFLTIEELLQDAKPLAEPDLTFASDFLRKKPKPS